jgi:UDP-4-amino-4,6-dideoxy-N-acetyl-beta-L-altrosamine transaminase
VGSKYAVAVSSATAGLHLAHLAIGHPFGSNVATSPISFVASANTIIYAGHTPFFVDIDFDSGSMSVDKLADLINQTKISTVVPVHYAGLPCDMKRINEICKEKNINIIEDAAHALGATYDSGEKVGSCTYSDITVFSFHPVKSITTGEGGMITTNDYNIYRKLLRLRSHGINKLDDPFLLPDQAQTGGTLDPWYYEMQELGFHYRITDIQCALALSQLKKLDSFIAKRRELVKIYDQAFHGDVNVFPAQISGRRISAHHLYVLRINYDAIGLARNKLMSNLKTHGIVSQVHYIPVPAQPYYRNLGFNPEDYPNAQRYYQEALSIPLFFDLTNEQQQQVISRINALIR